MFKDLSERRQRVLLFIAQYSKEKSLSPSYREIQKALAIASISTVYSDVHHLIEKGFLAMERGNYRSLQVVDDFVHEYMPPNQDGGAAAGGNAASSKAKGSSPAKDNQKVEYLSQIRNNVYDIPLYGNVAAGAPIFADDYVEDSIPLPADFFHNDQEEYFLLTISGDSMIEAGIYDGDNIIVRKQNTAKNGDQVVALIEDSATVKTFFKRPGYIELRPENRDMEPIIVTECDILGIVCGLYRLYRR